MYRGFKINIDETFFCHELNTTNYDIDTIIEQFNKYKKIGETPLAKKIDAANKHIFDYIDENGVLEGDIIQDTWFPRMQGKFDIFISHSHNDKDLAFALAGWMKEKFKLNCFLDQYVWSSADGLIKKLDNLCLRPKEKHYNYRDRNMTTSQVHAMLTSAILQIIDDCDILFFLNTPNSVEIIDNVHEYTLSPWIFLEIGFSKVVKKKWNNKKRKELARTIKAYSGITEAAAQMRMRTDTTHLTELNTIKLHEWAKYYERQLTRVDYAFMAGQSSKKEHDPLVTLHKLFT